MRKAGPSLWAPYPLGGGRYTAVLVLPGVLIAALAGCTSSPDSSPDQGVTADCSATAAVIQASPTQGTAPLSASFNASGSSSDGSIIAYGWDYGDGNVDTGVMASHQYLSMGDYEVTLTVTDDQDCRDSTSIAIQVSGGATFGVSGTVKGAEGMGLEGDTNNPATSFTPNNNLNQAQLIGSAVRIGGYVTAIPTSQAAISNATASDPVHITTMSETSRGLTHPFEDGDTVFVEGVGGMTELNDQEFKITNTTESTFDLEGVDGTNFKPYSSGGTVSLRPMRTDRFSSTTDLIDVYYATLAEDHSIYLLIADWDETDPSRIDLDLMLLDGQTFELVADSVDTTRQEQLVAPANGDYFIVVQAVSGGSTYTLDMDTGGTELAMRTGLSSFSPHAEGEIIVQLRPHAAAESARLSSANYAREVLGLTYLSGQAGKLLVKIPPDEAERAAMNAKIGAASVSREPAWIRELVPDDEAREMIKAVKSLRRHPDVLLAEPNYLRFPQAEPNDSGYVQQWHYPLIDLPQAWEITTGSPDVIVAVVDTGVFLEHEDLAGQLTGGYDFITDPARANDGDGIDPDPGDPGNRADVHLASFHGTHVAGTVAAASDNGIGVAGVAWGARVMPLRALGIGGGTDFDIAQAVRYAAGLSNESGQVPAEPADIINLSIAGKAFSQFSQDTFSIVRDLGVIVVAAAGNKSTSTPSYPSAYDGVISVAAVGPNLEQASYSNFGSTIDLAAPGGDFDAGPTGGVLSTFLHFSPGDEYLSAYTSYDGTSMACPHVAGVIALMKSVNPQLSPDDFDALLINGAITEDLGSAGRDDVFGHGLIDARLAVEQALALAGGEAPPSVLSVHPPQMFFGTDANTLSVQLTTRGATPLRLAAVEPEHSRVTVQPSEVDEDGMGSYEVTVDRAGLPDGSYVTGVKFVADSGTSVTLSISVKVGNPAGAEHPVLATVVLINSDATAVLGEATVESVNGEFAYGFPDVQPGDYYVLCGTDIDNDGFICEPGEACGSYPLLSQPETFQVTEDTTDINIPVTFNTPFNTLAAETLNRVVAKYKAGRTVRAADTE